MSYKVQHRFHEEFHLRHCLWQRIYVDYFRVNKNTDRSWKVHWRPDVFRQSFPCHRFYTPLYSFGSFRMQRRTFTTAWKNFLVLAQRMLTKISLSWEKWTQLNFLDSYNRWFQAKIEEKHLISAISTFELNKL